MSNTPLTSTDHSKILIFTLLMLPPTGFFCRDITFCIPAIRHIYDEKE